MELGFSVTNKPEDVCEFLSGDSNQHRVVFATYQSSEVIELAHKYGAPEFDFTVADEAHHCAGFKTSGAGNNEQISSFSRILYRDRIYSKKRLFMTATPRYISSNLKRQIRSGNDSDIEQIEVASMDDEADFGPKIHTLTFGEAIERDLLSDYQVVIYVTTEQTKELIDERVLAALVDRTGLRIDTDHAEIANLCGMLLAIKKYDLNHIITYHNSIAGAENLQANLRDIISALPGNMEFPDIDIETVSSKQTTKRRMDIVKKFRESTSGINILTNARCLTEGVDVRAVDSVAFFAPKWSKIDILQAVGRCLRKNKDNKIGTILIPVYVTPEMFESHDAKEYDNVLLGTNYSYIWQVLQAIKEHDDVLASELDAWRQEKGKIHKTSDDKVLDKVIFDMFHVVDIDNSEFLRSFETRVLELSTSNFDEGIGALEEYKKEHGNVLVPGLYKTENGYNLGVWIGSRRAEYKRGTLSEERIKRLEELEMVWDASEEAYQTGLLYLIEYKKEYGNVLVLLSYKAEDGYNLGTWIGSRRTEYKKGTLSEERIKRLEELEMVWDARSVSS
jgi:predicted helicase